MKLKFNITVHHGTDFKNVSGIIKNGFVKDSISCATQNFYSAKGFGNTVLSFKYPFILKLSFKTLKIDLEFFKRFIYDYINKDLIVCVAGFKPTNPYQNDKGLNGLGKIKSPCRRNGFFWHPCL